MGMATMVYREYRRIQVNRILRRIPLCHDKEEAIILIQAKKHIFPTTHKSDTKQTKTITPKTT